MINKKLNDIMDMSDFDFLFDQMDENVKKDIKDFSDVLNLDSALKREVYINGEICDGVGSSTDGVIRFWNRYDDAHNIPIEERKPIKIYIDSVGGSLVDTFSMIDSIALSKTPVWTICTGAAYSGGCFLFIAGDRRIAYPKASFMMHEGATSTGGDAHKFVNYTSFYKKELAELKDHVLKFTKMSDEEYENIRRDDYWLTSAEALEKGFCDEIATSFV